jgi:hypothetical protein
MVCGLLNCYKSLAGRGITMHDILVALAFVAMVACPAIVAAFPKRESEDEA